MRLTLIASLSLAALSCLLTACGGGSSAPSTNTTAVTYTATAAAGELLDYTLDTTKLTYSYTVTRSQFGLTGQGGSGTLVNNSDGTYSPEGVPDTKILPVKNGMLAGTVKLNIQGTERDIPLIGFTDLVTSLANAQDTYDYVERVCAQPGSQCSSGYGTFQITSGGTWTNCSQGIIGTSCSGAGHALTNGTFNSLGGGLWQVLAASGQEIGTGLAFKAPDGQNVWVIDLDRAVADGGTGIGILAGASKNFVSSAETNGTWIFDGTTGAAQYAGTLTANGSDYTTSGVLLSGSGPPPINASATLTQNSPWNGFVQTSNGDVALLAGNGMYAAVNATAGNFEVGLRK